MHSNFTPAENANFIAATTVANAEAFMGRRADASVLYANSLKLVSQLAEVEQQNDPSAKVILDLTKLLLTAMVNTSATKDPARLLRWCEVMAAMAKLVRMEAVNLREPVKPGTKSREDMEAQLAELDAAIAAAPCWGAAVSEMDEERQGIKRTLGASEDPLPVREESTREALFMCAASCQGGHSDAGAAAAEVIGIPFPITMDALMAKAIEERRDPDALWPWLMRQRKKQAKAERT